MVFVVLSKQLYHPIRINNLALYIPTVVPTLPRRSAKLNSTPVVRPCYAENSTEDSRCQTLTCSLPCFSRSTKTR
ncbi:hypothetical protein EMIT0P291_110110 [Pseudomonas sp. IT-P291]